VPIALNCQLVRYCEVLGLIAGTLGFTEEAIKWKATAHERAQRIRDLCWNDREGFFFEYDFVNRKQLPFWSLCAYWAVWAGVATEDQVARMSAHLPRFEQARGLTVTDKLYPSPHREFPTLQWAYPYCWPPLMMMVTEALAGKSGEAAARRAGAKYLEWVLQRYDETGTVWEKYVAVPGEAETAERYGTVSFYSWAAASIAVIGRLLGLDQ